MKSYTHSQTYDAVAAVVNLFAKAATMNNQLKAAREAMSAKYYQDEEAKVFETFRNDVMQTRLKIREKVEALQDIARSNKMKNLVKAGNNEEDFNLLTLPVTLTEEELTMLVDRHLGNELFVRAVKEYVEKRGIRISDEFSTSIANAMVYQKEHDGTASAKRIGEYLESYMPTEAVLLSAPELKAQTNIFNHVEDSGLLVKLDSKI